jgi:hypothetical protein
MDWRISVCYPEPEARDKINMEQVQRSHFNSNITSFFRFVNKRASYTFGIISLAHAPVNVSEFSIGSINCVQHIIYIHTVYNVSRWITSSFIYILFILSVGG